MFWKECQKTKIKTEIKHYFCYNSNSIWSYQYASADGSNELFFESYKRAEGVLSGIYKNEKIYQNFSKPMKLIPQIFVLLAFFIIKIFYLTIFRDKIIVLLFFSLNIQANIVMSCNYFEQFYVNLF